MTAGTRTASMRSVIRYRMLVDGRLTLLGEQHRCGGAGANRTRYGLVVDVADASELDALLERLGDLGVNVVSLEQEPQQA